jgi:thymidine kinase
MEFNNEELHISRDLLNFNDVITQKTTICIFVAVKASNHAKVNHVLLGSSDQGG